MIEAWGRRRGCLAARGAGMRVALVSPWFGDAADDGDGDAEPHADVAFCDGLASVGYDDFSTPGQFWLNLALPRDAAGNKADPDDAWADGAYEEDDDDGDGDDAAGGEVARAMSEGELEAILSDLGTFE